LSNCSIWLFDEKNASKFPTFGYKLLEKDHNITGPISFAKEMLYTMLETHDNEPQEDHNTVRVITIPSKGTSPPSFNLSRKDKQELFRSEREAAREFFDERNFV